MRCQNPNDIKAITACTNMIQGTIQKGEKLDEKVIEDFILAKNKELKDSPKVVN